MLRAQCFRAPQVYETCLSVGRSVRLKHGDVNVVNALSQQCDEMRVQVFEEPLRPLSETRQDTPE